MNELIKQELAKVRALIDTPDKWTKGMLVDENGCMCISGALAINAGYMTPEGKVIPKNLPLKSVSYINYPTHHEHIYTSLNEHPVVKQLAFTLRQNNERIGNELKWDVMNSHLLFSYNDISSHTDILSLIDETMNAL
jgi:hypothetical protein